MKCVSFVSSGIALSKNFDGSNFFNLYSGRNFEYSIRILLVLPIHLS